jgi:hypothetical protein
MLENREKLAHWEAASNDINRKQGRRLIKTSSRIFRLNGKSNIDIRLELISKIYIKTQADSSNMTNTIAADQDRRGRGQRGQRKRRRRRRHHGVRWWVSPGGRLHRRIRRGKQAEEEQQREKELLETEMDF